MGLYRAKINGDEGVFKAPKTRRDVLGYELVEKYFVDSSGFGAEDEPALTISHFLQKVKAGYYYGITGEGQFQVYVGEFKRVNRKAQFEAQGIKSSRLVANNTRLTEYLDGHKVLMLHQTDIITWRADGVIVLNNGGWDTVTTRDRFSRFLPDGWRIYRWRGVSYFTKDWHADDFRKKSIKFYNGMEVK